MADLDDLTVDTIRQAIRFKYQNLPGRTNCLIAEYKPANQTVIVILPGEFSKLIDEKIYELLIAMQAYAYEHPEDATPAEIIQSSPRKSTSQQESGSMIVTTKSPQQLEKDRQAAIDKLGSE